MHRYLEAQRATGKYLSERQALSLFGQVAAGTYHLHANGDPPPPPPPAPPGPPPPPPPPLTFFLMNSRLTVRRPLGSRI
jgi:hypothetical protein